MCLRVFSGFPKVLGREGKLFNNSIQRDSARETTRGFMNRQTSCRGSSLKIRASWAECLFRNNVDREKKNPNLKRKQHKQISNRETRIRRAQEYCEHMPEWTTCWSLCIKLLHSLSLLMLLALPLGSGCLLSGQLIFFPTRAGERNQSHSISHVIFMLYYRHWQNSTLILNSCLPDAAWLSLWLVVAVHLEISHKPFTGHRCSHCTQAVPTSTLCSMLVSRLSFLWKQ